MPVTAAEGVPTLLLQVVAGWRQIVAALSGLGVTQGIHSNLLSQTTGTRYGFALTHPAIFEQAGLPVLIEQLIAADPHLVKTCITPARLGLTLDILVLNSLAAEPAALQNIRDESIRDHLLNEIYSAPYSRTFYGRLYNVQSDACPLSVDLLDGELKKMPTGDIPDLTGELTPTSTLHRTDTGDVFIIFRDQGSEDELHWWERCWGKAHQFIGVLKYVKANIVDLDYSALSHTPDWVNRIRRYGIGIAGRPRLEVQALPYMLSHDDHSTALRYLAAVFAHRELLENTKPKLYQATRTAGDFYESYHRRETSVERLISLAIALEALFSPDTKQEIATHLSLTVALFLGENRTAARDIAPFIKKIYDARSKIMHRGEDPFSAAHGKGAMMTESDLRRLADLVREAILRALTLHARGEYAGKREPFLRDLLAAVFDDEKLARVREQSDWEKYLKEKGFGVADARA